MGYGKSKITYKVKIYLKPSNGFDYAFVFIKCLGNYVVMTVTNRLDGPAIKRIDGTKEWWQNNKLHRLDGPAIENASDHRCWYINGDIYYSKEEFDLAIVNYKTNRKKK